MRNALLYFSGFLVLMLLQEVVLAGINMTEWVSVYIYIMVVVLFPMQAKPTAVILASAALGVLADVYCGMLAVTSISMVWLGYVRFYVLKLTLPAEVIMAGGTPFARRVGVKYFLRYSFLMTVLYILPYTFLEVMTLENIDITMIRVATSSVATTLLIYILQLPLKSK